MAIGTIGASSGALEALPAGAIEKIGTFEVGGIKSLGTLQPGKYMVTAPTETRLLKNFNQPITDVQKNGQSIFEISQAVEVEAELLNPSFSPINQYGQDSGGTKIRVIPSQSRITNTSSSADGQTISYNFDDDNFYLTFDGGDTWDYGDQNSSSASSEGTFNNPGLTDWWGGGVTVLDNGILVVSSPTIANEAKYSSDSGQTWTSFDVAYSSQIAYMYHVAHVKSGNFLYMLLQGNTTNYRAVVKIDFSSGSPVVVQTFDWQNTNLNAGTGTLYNQMINFNDKYIKIYCYTSSTYTFGYFIIDLANMPSGYYGQDNATLQAPISSDAVSAFRDNGSGTAWTGAGQIGTYSYPYIYGTSTVFNSTTSEWTLDNFGASSDPFQDAYKQAVGARHGYNRSTSSQNYFNKYGLLSRTRYIGFLRVGTLTIYNGSNNDQWSYNMVVDACSNGNGVSAVRVKAHDTEILPGFPETSYSTGLLNGRWYSSGSRADLQPITIYRMA